MELDEGRLAGCVDQAEGVDAESLHEAERARDGAIRHDPQRHVDRFRRERDEIPEIVVRCLRLREATVGLLLRGVDQIGKLYRVLNEEYRDVVADDVPVALLGIELDGEAAHVARKIRGALIAGDRREAHEGFGLLARSLKQIGLGDVGERFISRRTRARRSPSHGPRARGCVHGRNGRSSRGSDGPRARSGRAVPL